MSKSKFVRMTKVLSLAFGIFLKIYWYKLTKKPQSEWDKLWGEIGSAFRRTLFELEGLLIKVGQILSTRADLLPPAFIKQIEDLTDHVPPSSWNEIEEILISEWGGPLHQHVKTIEQKAVASASIGEVYKGILMDGTDVAIKVQRPNIQSIIHTDFNTLRIIIWFADHFIPVPKGFINFKVLYQELKQVIERELDYKKELDTQQYFSERFKNLEYLKIPFVYPELSSSKVLVMEWVEGTRINDMDAIEQLQINRHELSQRLLELFLPQWLEPGTFHADPHTGNMLIGADGKIILLDFGMVGVISKKDASYFQGLIEGLLSKNYAKAVECLTSLGFLLPEVESRTIEKLLAEMMSFQPEQIKEIDLLALKMEMNDIVRSLPIQVPTRFVFLGRSFVTIEGIIVQLSPDEDMMELAKPVFMKWLNQAGNSKWSFVWQWLQSQPLFRIFHSVSELLTAPKKYEELKELEQRRHFRFLKFESAKKHIFQLGLLGLAGVGVGIYSAHTLLLNLSIGVTAFSAIGYIIGNVKQEKWMKYMHEKRKR